MRIGIDARELCGRPTGVGRYLAGLLREWSREEHARRHEFILYAPDTPDVSLDARRFRTRVIAGKSGTWWEQVQLPPVAGEDHLDLFFAPAYTAPLRLRVPIVLTIHDLSYIAHPEWFPLREGARRRFFTRHAAARARSILTISEFSRGEIIGRLGVPAERLHVVPLGLDPPGALARPATVHADATILYVGSIFNRRHVPDLIRAFGALVRTHPSARLDIVGDDRTYPHEDIARQIASAQLNDQATHYPYVPFERLRELYAGARAFAFLSEYEGQGMTPLEALAAGLPPVVLDTAVARETLGDAAVFVPLGNIDATARGLELALFDDPTRARILAAAPATLARYDWPRAARQVLAVLEASA